MFQFLDQYLNLLQRQKKIGCSSFQIFSRNPRNWQAKDLSKDEIENFLKKKHK
jgi:deoxyribonuclease IV